MKVTIRRTGGFAGLTREWSTMVDPEEPSWRDLLARLPIDERQREAASRDRFVYLVTCEPPTKETPYWRCEVPEGSFTGPWQDLLDRVRDEDSEVACEPPRET